MTVCRVLVELTMSERRYLRVRDVLRCVFIRAEWCPVARLGLSMRASTGITEVTIDGIRPRDPVWPGRVGHGHVRPSTAARVRYVDAG